MEEESYDASVPIAVQAQENKRRKRRIMKIAVYFMFGIISLGVFAIWLFHKDSVESLKFGSCFIFTVKLRSLEVKNKDGDGVLYGDMGKRLQATQYDHCWDSGYKSYEDHCLYWRKMARLRVSQVNGSSTCYTLLWEGLKKEFLAEDCFYLQHYHWYGYLSNQTRSFPITGVNLEDTVFFNQYPEQQTENLIPAWFGSQGVSVFVDSSYPFNISWNATDKRQFCIKSQLSPTEDMVPTNLLQYTICQGKSIKDVYSVSQNQRIGDAMDSDAIMSQNNHLHAKPAYKVTSKADIPAVLESMRKNGTDCSYLQLYEHWEAEYGDLEIDPNMADQVKALISEADLHGCKPVLTVSTFFSFRSKLFQEGVEKGYFVKDSLNIVTRMVLWHGQEGAVVDVSKPESSDWFQQHIVKLVSQNSITALKLLHVEVPPDSLFYDENMTNLDYTRVFYRDFTALNFTLMLEMASGFIPAPAYVPVHMAFYGDPGTSCMNTSIPNSLTMGLGGYPLLVANADRMVNPNTTEEMFQRWLQLAIFYPLLEIPNTPLMSQSNMRDFLNAVLNFRREQIMPYLNELWEEERQLPIIRPMWWIAPTDSYAFTIDDQFVVGDRLLVAPVLCEGTAEREVYLPEGQWVRFGSGNVVKGPKTVRVPTRKSIEIPLFLKQKESGKTGNVEKDK